MADKDIPNSIATPNWKPVNYEIVPLRNALKTELINGTENEFAGNLPRNWCVPGVGGRVAYGGFCAALILSTSQKYFASRYPSKNQPDPVHAHVQFLDALPEGPYVVEIKDIKLGGKQSVIQVFLRSPQCLNISVLSLVTMGNLASTGHTIETPLVQLPDINDCQRWTDAFLFHLSPSSTQARQWTPKGGPNPLWSPEVGRNKRDAWVKLDDEGEAMSIAHLGILIDQVPSIPLNYEKGGLLGMAKWVFPTMSLNIDIRRDPKGEELLLQRVVMNECRNGRFDMEVKMIDTSGRLVATSTHSNLMLPVVRNQKTATVPAPSRL